MANDYDWRRFDDIPAETVFADKFGRLYTKLGPGHARSHEVERDGYWHYTFDESREYFDASDDELDDCDLWDSWPFYAVNS